MGYHMRAEILGVKAPQKECTDKKCPFHGEIIPKEEIFRGVVVRRDVNHSATIEWSRAKYVPKYERSETRRSRMRVHNPACINAEVGQEVIAARTRPLSKTKTHVIIGIVGASEVKLSADSSLLSGSVKVDVKKVENIKK